MVHLEELLLVPFSTDSCGTSLDRVWPRTLGDSADGRVLVPAGFSVDSGGLFIVDPNDSGQTPPTPYWSSAIPDDGTVSIDVGDAATINGVPTLLLQVKNPDDGTLELASVHATNEDRRVIAAFSDASLGLFPKGFLDIDLRDTESVPAIGGSLITD